MKQKKVFTMIIFLIIISIFFLACKIIDDDKIQQTKSQKNNKLNKSEQSKIQVNKSTRESRQPIKIIPTADEFKMMDTIRLISLKKHPIGSKEEKNVCELLKNK